MLEDGTAEEKAFEPAEARREATLFVITAPSGAGKSTLISRVMPQLEKARFSVSWTTRAPRPGEVNGRDYHFIDHDTFEKMIEQDGFLEWARVHGEFYGTGRQATLTLLQEGYDVILDIDVQGAAQVRRAALASTSIFILPPSLDVLERRLQGRGTETEAKIRKRIEAARMEMEQAGDFDHRVVNDDLERAVRELRAILTRRGDER